MGWAEQLPSGKWRAMIRVAGRKKNATPGRTYGTKSEATRVAGREEDDQRRPGAHDPRKARITWGRWANDWWSLRDVSPSTESGDRSNIRVHIGPRWNGAQLGSISRDDVQRWVRDMERGGASPAHVVRVFHTFSGSLEAAVHAGRLAANPCKGVRLPRVPQRDERYLTYEEVERIAFFLDEPWRRVLFTLCGTGLRWGELAALHWHRVEEDRLHVTLGWNSKHHRYGTPKDKDRREVPLLDWVARELDDLRRVSTTRGRCGAPHPPALGQPCRSRLVFPDRTGSPTHHAAFLWHWERVVGSWEWFDRAGNRYPTEAKALAADERSERRWHPGLARIEEPTRIHDTRHTFASWFLHEGGSLYELASILGHHSVVVTERYAHLEKGRHAATRERMAGKGPRTEVAPHMPHDGDDAASNVARLADRRRSQGA